MSHTYAVIRIPFSLLLKNAVKAIGRLCNIPSRNLANELRSFRRFISGALKRNPSVSAERTPKCIHDTIPRFPRLTLAPENRICCIIINLIAGLTGRGCMIRPMVSQLETINPVHFVRIAVISSEVLTLLLSNENSLHYGEVRRIRNSWSSL
jgi:hypothetical protein